MSQRGKHAENCQELDGDVIIVNKKRKDILGNTTSNEIVEKNNRKPKHTCDDQTQEQYLTEAKKTEAKNLASLNDVIELYQKIVQKEKQKKKQNALFNIKRLHRRLPPSTPHHVFNIFKGDDHYVYFQNSETFLESFPLTKYGISTIKPKKNEFQTCIITGKPARYIDPFTKLPFATLGAFKEIRKNYLKKAETKYIRKISSPYKKTRKVIQE